MDKKLSTLFFFLLCSFSAHAQTFPTAPINGPGPPINPCSNGVLYTDTTNGNLWSCKTGAWQNTTGSGGGVTTSQSVQFVGTNGNDSNDGLSWLTPKFTIYKALCSLPGGNCSTQTFGAGTILAGPGVTASPTTNGGIWLMGANDPAFADPPAGWLKCSSGCALSIIGVANTGGGPNGHKPRVALLNPGGSTDNNHPGVWISALSSPITLSNFQFNYPGRAFVIGECSDNNQDGTCGVQGTIFDNDGGLINQTVTNGPCTTIGGNTFWVYFRDFGCAGNYNAPSLTSDLHAAVVIAAATSPGAGLIYFNDVNFAGGGIISHSGSSGTQLYVSNAIEEGDFSHAIPSVVSFNGWNSANSDAILENIQQADGGGGSMPAVQTAPQTSSAQAAIYGTTQGPTVLNGNFASGPAVQLNPIGDTFSPFATDPLKQGQQGFYNGYLVAKTDVARRLAGFTPGRFTNLANSASSDWTFTNTGAASVLTPSLSDPFGGTGAAKIANSTANDNTLTLGLTSYTSAIGDWVVTGVWGENLAQTGDSFVQGCPGQPTYNSSYTYKAFGPFKGDGQWQFLWMAQKMSTVTSGNICALVHFNSAIQPTLYGPVFYIIPAGTLSDNEVVNFANTMNSVDTSCGVGAICNVAGHPLQLAGDAFATLGSQKNGTVTYCSDCTIANPCAGSGTGAIAKKLNGVWVCN